ncbi:hypothetical protein COP2_025392 [Malus domestica]
MGESGQGCYPLHSLMWGLGIHCLVSLGVGKLFLCTAGIDVGLIGWQKCGLCEVGVKMGTNQSHNFKCWSSIYGSFEMVVGRIKGAQPLFSHTGRFLQAYAFNAYGIAFPLVLLEDSRQIQDSRLVLAGASRVFSAKSKYSAAPLRLSKVWSLLLMENPGVEELVVHLDRSLDLSTMEIGVKLVGKALTQKSLNRWGIRNILNSAWKDLGEVGIKWV